MLFASPLRLAYLAGFLACAGLLAAAYYFEYVLFLDPCPLCMVQRLATLLIGLGFLAAFISYPHRWGLIAALVFTFAATLFGVWSADHHVWIQNLPAADVPDCGPSFEYLMATLPLTELLTIMLQGDGNCAEIDWQFWGLSMPEWTRIWFSGFAMATLAALIWHIRTIMKVK